MIDANEMEQLRVPLSALPGFDPVGLFVRAYARDFPELCSERHVSDSPDYEGPAYDDVVLADRDREVVAVDAVTVDLADASTADRVARWRALQCSGLQAGPTAPAWVHLGDGIWGLAWVGGRRKFCRDCCLPEGADPDDSRRLPDGSRYVDRLALARVAVTTPHRGEA